MNGLDLVGWIPADPALRFAVFTGAAVYLVALVQLLVVTWLHFRNRRREQRLTALKAQVAPVLLHTIEGLPYPLPRIAEHDRDALMLQWLYYVESTRGDSRLRLRELGQALQFPAAARRLLRRRALGSRLLATAALGRLGDREAWDSLVTIVDRGDPVISLLALRSLTQIEPAAALTLLLDRLPRRPDWPVARLNTLVRELPTEVASEAIVKAIDGAPQDELPRLLQLLEIIRPTDVWRVIGRFLDGSQDVDVLAAALRMVDDPRALTAVRALVEHPSWVVRTRVASALGRIGEPDDVERLRRLLADPVWWVRFRAAQALLRLPFLDRARLREISGTLEDRFARDMLTQTLAESAGRD